jgi:hypothetical protein
VTLRLLCDENLPRALVEALRGQGHDAAWVATLLPGASDRAVLGLVAAERRILVTFDKDFGELAARAPDVAAQGILLLRLPCHPLPEAALSIAAAIDARRDWAGHFAVIEPGRVRLRRIEGNPA